MKELFRCREFVKKKDIDLSQKQINTNPLFKEIFFLLAPPSTLSSRTFPLFCTYNTVMKLYADSLGCVLGWTGQGKKVEKEGAEHLNRSRKRRMKRRRREIVYLRYETGSEQEWDKSFGRNDAGADKFLLFEK